MHPISQLEDLQHITSPVHLAIGVFDGLHLGHRAVMDSAFAAARQAGGQVWMLTFSPHPLKLLRPELAPKRLLGDSLRKRLLVEWGLSGVVEIPFTAEFAGLVAEAFVARLQQACPTLASVSVGEDWRFGKGRTGSVEMLRNVGLGAGFAVLGISPVEREGSTVSSTRIRAAVEQGDLLLAEKLLGRPYSLAGKVASGRKLARKLGFPTANVALEVECLPPLGVYAVQLSLGGEIRTGVANLGVRPTVETGEVAPQLEVHIFDYTGDLYDQTLDVTLTKYIRPERRLGSLDELKAQIAEDCRDAREGAFTA